MAAAHAQRQAAWRDLRVAAFIACLWLGAWLVLSASVWIAGGHPSASPVEFIDPSAMLRDVRSAGGSFALWDLVAATSTITAWRFWTALAVIAIGMCTCGIVIGRLRSAVARSSLRRFVPSGRSVVRTAHWARKADLRAIRGRRRRVGVFLLGTHRGRMLTTQPETSVLVIGPTRSGKTAGLVIPNLLDWDGPAIATSTKGELVDLTAGHRQSRGPVYVYDPTGDIGGRYRTVTWSPLAGCQSLDRAWMVASWLCARESSTIPLCITEISTGRFLFFVSRRFHRPGRFWCRTPSVSRESFLVSLLSPDRWPTSLRSVRRTDIPTHQTSRIGFRRGVHHAIAGSASSGHYGGPYISYACRIPLGPRLADGAKEPRLELRRK